MKQAQCCDTTSWIGTSRQRFQNKDAGKSPITRRTMRKQFQKWLQKVIVSPGLQNHLESVTWHLFVPTGGSDSTSSQCQHYPCFQRQKKRSQCQLSGDYFPTWRGTRLSQVLSAYARAVLGLLYFPPSWCTNHVTCTMSQNQHITRERGWCAPTSQPTVDTGIGEVRHLNQGPEVLPSLPVKSLCSQPWCAARERWACPPPALC